MIHHIMTKIPQFVIKSKKYKLIEQAFH